MKKKKLFKSDRDNNREQIKRLIAKGSLMILIFIAIILAMELYYGFNYIN